MKNYRKLHLNKIIDDNDGILSVAEQKKDIPFMIKRVYYIYSLELKESKRGFHAHKELEQAIFCLNGSFRLKTDDGYNKKSELLNNPNEGIFIGKNLWHTMSEFSEDCIILVFASDYYKESDYIRDYNEFISYINEIK